MWKKNEIRTLKIRMWMTRAGVHRCARKRLTMDVTDHGGHCYSVEMRGGFVEGFGNKECHKVTPK